MVMATNGTLITEGTVIEMKASGIQRISISLDGPDAETHDAFRKVKGSFEGSLQGINVRLRHEGGGRFRKLGTAAKARKRES